MYKKITRNVVEDIVEEHYDHPIAPQLRKLAERNYKPMIAPVDPEIFKANIKEYYSDYGKKMAAIIYSITGTLDDLTTAEEEMFANIDNIGKLTRPYYGIEFGEKMNQSARGYALSIATAVNYLKIGLDIKTITDNRIVGLLAKDLSISLSQYNNNWSQPIIQDKWIKVAMYWLDAARFKLRKDDAGAEAEIKKADEMLDNFAGALADGIILQFQNQFGPVQKVLA